MISPTPFIVVSPLQFAASAGDADRTVAISQIMRLRGDCDGLEQQDASEMPFLEAIPVLERAQISHFLEEIGRTGSIVKALGSVGFNTIFTPQVLEVIVEGKRKNEEISVYAAIVIFYQAIAFSYCTHDFDADGAFWLIQAVNKAVSAGHVLPAIVPLLNGVVEKIIMKWPLEWRKDLACAVLEYYDNHRDFLKHNFTLFITFFGRCLDAHDEECANVVINFLYSCMSDDIHVFNSELLDSVVARLEPHIHAFEVTPLEILALASKSFVSEKIKNCYIALPGGLVELIKGCCNYDLFVPETARWSYERVREMPMFDFNFLQSDCFSDGFAPLPDLFWQEIQQPSKLYEPKGQAIIQTISAFLCESEPKCQKVFMDSFCLVLCAIAEKARFRAYFTVFVHLLQRLSRCDLIESHLEVLTSHFIFDEGNVLFCKGTLDNNTSALRQIVIRLLMEVKHPRVIAHLLKLHQDKPFLFAEDLGRIMSTLNDNPVELFLVETIIEYALHVSFVLQAMNPSNEVKIARNIMFLFIFAVAKTKFFGGRAIANHFLRFLFISDISPLVVAALKEGCSNLRAHESGRIVMSFEQLFLECAARKDDIRYASMAITIAQVIYESIRMNPCMAKPFWKLFDAIVLCMNVRPSVEILTVLINIISLSQEETIRPSTAEMMARYITTSFPDDKSIIRKVMNLLAFSDQYAIGSFFIIERPEMMSFVVACCSSPSIMKLFLRKVQVLTTQSFYNIGQCHKGQLDQILIKFIAMESNVAEFRYHGFDMHMEIDKESLQSIIVPLLVQMCCYYPSHAVAMNLLELCRRGNAVAIGIMNKILSHTSMIASKVSRIGFFKENVVATGLKGTDLQKEFTMCCRFRIDLSLSIASNSTIELIYIVDSRNWSISLLLNQLSLVVKYERGRTKTVVQIVHTVPANKWFSLVVSFKIEGRHRLINTYVNLDKQSDSEMCVFSLDGPLKVILGKTVTQKKWFDTDFGIVGDFRMFDHAFQYEDVENYVHRSKQLISGREYSLKFEKSDPEPPQFYSFFKNANLITKVVESGTTALGPVMSILKSMYLLLPGASVPADDVIDILNLTPTMNSNIYFCFYSFFSVLRDKRDWFDKIITNFMIWSRCDTTSRTHILQHWSSVIPDTCSDLIKEKSCFSSLLAAFDEFFGAEDANVVNRSLFSMFLRRLAYINFPIEDQRILFVFACGSKTTHMTREYLEILRDVASLLDEEISRNHYLELLGMMLRHNQPEIVHIVLMILHEMKYQVDSMILAYLLPCCIELQQVLQYLISQLTVCPRFSELCAILALILGQDVSTSLVAICSLPGAVSSITRGNTWFLWPILLLYQTPANTMTLMMQHLALLIRDVETLKHVVNLMILMNASLAHMDVQPSICELLRIIAGMRFGTKKEVEAEIVRFCVHCFLFHSDTWSHSGAMLRAFRESPFGCLDFSPKKDSPPKTHVISSNGVKTFFESRPHISLVYGIRCNDDGSFADLEFLELAWSIIQRDDQQYEYADIVKYFLIIDKSEQAENRIDMNELVPELAANFNTMFQADIDALTNTTLERVNMAERTADSVENMNFDPKGKNQILNMERERLLALSTPRVRSGNITIQSARLCNGHPALLRSSLNTAKWLSLKKGANCSVIFQGLKRDAHISEGMKRIKLQFEDRARVIPAEKIEYVSFRTKLQFEICTKSGKAYFVTKFKNVKAQSSLFGYQKGMDYQWTSNFECLLWINRMAGRSFNNKDAYPIFPSVLADYEDPTRQKVLVCDTSISPELGIPTCNLADVLTHSTSVAPEFYCFPERVKGQLPTWASTPYELVYGLRKCLESNAISARLKLWVKKFWEQESKHIWTRSFDPMSRLTERLEPVVNPYVADFTINLNPLSFAVSNGLHISVLSRYGVHNFELDKEKIQEISSIPLDRNLVQDMQLFGVGATIFMYNKYTRTIWPVGSKEIEVGIIDPTTFTTFGDMWIFCRDSCDVWSCKRENFRPVFERICQTDYQITALDVNERYHSLVFATVDGKVHFHTINGDEINKVEINEVATKLLITDVWGFVVIASDLKLFVYNVNGTFVKSHELQHPIVCWSHFSSHDGFDFIVFSDTSGHIGFFEVFYPSEIVALLELRDTMAVNFDTESQSFVAVSSDGHVKMINCDIRTLMKGRGFALIP